MILSVCIVLMLIAGIFAGYFYAPDLGKFYEIILYLIIFLIGIELGQSFKLTEIRKLGILAIKLPLATMTGSMVGGVTTALLLKMKLKWGLAIGAGCGWYSLTGPLIAKYSPIYGTLGFLANIGRELIAILLYPLLLKITKKEIIISIGGATTMDTTLPIITKLGGPELALIAFIHGFVLTILIPIVLSFIVQL